MQRTTVIHPAHRLLALALLPAFWSSCVVSQRCFGGEDCAKTERCDRASGLCIAVAPLPDLGRPTPDFNADGDATPPFGDGQATDSGQPIPLHCPLPGMVLVADAFCADIWEASRVDATASAPGNDDSHAVSQPGVIPWQVGSNAEATAACAAAGKRLCLPAEWRVACQGPAQTAYAYGETYEPKTCNGIDTFEDWGFHLEPTGSFPGCTNAWGVFDLNGNIWEHTAAGDDTTVRGGAFNCSDSRTLHRCDYIPGSWTPTALGFRCCANAVPMLTDQDAGGDGPADAGVDADGGAG